MGTGFVLERMERVPDLRIQQQEEAEATASVAIGPDDEDRALLWMQKWRGRAPGTQVGAPRSHTNVPFWEVAHQSAGLLAPLPSLLPGETEGGSSVKVSLLLSGSPWAHPAGGARDLCSSEL